MSTEVRWISAREIDSLGITMTEVMDAVETGFAALGRGEGEMPAKIGIHPREDCFIHAMPCCLGGDIDRAGVKCVSGYPPNPARGLPYISGIMLLNDPETGLPQAVMDAAWITAWRTGAASGVYARRFGNPETTSVTIVGTGVQGRVNLLAMKEVFPKLKDVRCHDIFEAATQRFIDDMGPKLPDAVFSAHTDLETAVRDTDVLITCTPIVESPERAVRWKWLKDDCMVIAVDYDACVDEKVFRGAHFTCDNRNQYVWTQKQGIYFQNGYPGPEEIDADMCELCAGQREAVREGRRGAVLMGIATHDVMTAALVYERAAEAGIGILVEL
ncbi:ornithine cyclodeaminase family protein [Pseudodesulfovibrio thermohalotolerans]|uniref:ornithine cyclodeaminase family protein n=1 Tax=Pseudodesulfovibrio thermohalotolerans TaxID=2880651 RepID=UPI0024410751|nr:ornithine cyclodeaminase family protein [Pseudodesulfovibrio thermohalotolerans]WFS64048.1 ornithine cyclodeaminase family protein [Pseudodesulfovibrio thermohalotolerans]